MDSRQGLHRFASLYLHQLLLGLHHPYVDAAQRQEAYANACNHLQSLIQWNLRLSGISGRQDNSLLRAVVSAVVAIGSRAFTVAIPSYCRAMLALCRHAVDMLWLSSIGSHNAATCLPWQCHRYAMSIHTMPRSACHQKWVTMGETASRPANAGA